MLGHEPKARSFKANLLPKGNPATITSVHFTSLTKAPRTDSETRVKMKGEKMSGSETKERKRILIEKKDSFCPNFAALEDNELCFR